jgi:hypothetical protein
MATTLKDFLGYQPLTKMVTKVRAGIPKVLPDKFFNVGQRVTGNRFGRVAFEGTRQTVPNLPYLGNAKQINKQGYETQDFQMLTPKASMNFTDEFLDIYRKFAEYAPQDNRFLEIMRMQTKQMTVRFENTRVQSVQSLLANAGKIYLDANGNILPTSSGASLTIDMGVPPANVGNVGSLITTWASASTDIVSQILNLKSYALQQTNYPLKYAFYGKNVANYVSANTTFLNYLARNPAKNQSFLNTGTIPDGLFDLEWIAVQDAYFVDSGGTIRETFPADQVTFCPELSDDIWTMYEGSTPVVGSFEPQSNAETALRSMVDRPGMVSYAVANHEPLSITQYMVDCFLPVIQTPKSFLFVDTTP